MSVNNALKKVIVYGGQGALGSVCVKHLVLSNWWVANVDYKQNKQANLNIVVPQTSWEEQEKFVINKLNTSLEGDQVDGIICVANGWDAGNATVGLSKQIEFMTKKCIWSSTITATLATKYLRPGGLVVLNGSIHALQGTPRTIAFGMVKASVHHLTKSLAHASSGLPANSVVVAILPDILDTEKNRKWMPIADFTCFTPLNFVAELLERWLIGDDRPSNGSLIAIKTRYKISKLKKIST